VKVSDPAADSVPRTGGRNSSLSAELRIANPPSKIANATPTATTDFLLAEAPLKIPCLRDGLGVFRKLCGVTDLLTILELPGVTTRQPYDFSSVTTESFDQGAAANGMPCASSWQS
jgi:hypothetical protein